MEIEIGKFYENRTRKYLLPCLKAYGSTFEAKYSSIVKLAVGIFDYLLEGSVKADTKNIYILCDSGAYPNNFKAFLEWVRLEYYYVVDYSIESEIINSRKHMIVLLIPERFHRAYDMFLVGNYSLMYDPEEIDYLFPDKVKKEGIRKVLQKDLSLLPNFCEELNVKFETSVTCKDIEEFELELPPCVDQHTEEFHHYLTKRYKQDEK